MSLGLILKVMAFLGDLRKCFRKAPWGPCSASYTPPGIHVLTTGNLHIEWFGLAVVYQGAQQLWSGSIVLQRGGSSALSCLRKTVIPLLRKNNFVFVFPYNAHAFVCAFKNLRCNH